MPKVPLTDKPGKSNWVEKTGALKPKGSNWIRRTAEHLKGKGMETGRAIATAVNAAKKMCATGKTNLPNAGQVNALSKAEACAAVAKWEGAKAKTKAAKAVTEAELKIDSLDLVPEDLREAVSLSHDEKVKLAKGQVLPSMLIEGLTLLAIEDGTEPVDALRESVADVRRWAFGINSDREEVGLSLAREAAAALEPWDSLKMRTHSKLIAEGAHAGDERLGDTEFIDLLEARAGDPRDLEEAITESVVDMIGSLRQLCES